MLSAHACSLVLSLWRLYTVLAVQSVGLKPGLFWSKRSECERFWIKKHHVIVAIEVSIIVVGWWTELLSSGFHSSVLLSSRWIYPHTATHIFTLILGYCFRQEAEKTGLMRKGLTFHSINRFCLAQLAHLSGYSIYFLTTQVKTWGSVCFLLNVNEWTVKCHHTSIFYNVYTAFFPNYYTKTIPLWFLPYLKCPVSLSGK